MKQLMIICCVAFSITVCAQTKIPTLDKSPMDMSYYPANYPLLKIQDNTSEPLVARVIYSRPQKNGRVIFGELLEYGKVWRLGANEATEIEFFQNVKINDVKIKKGRYTLYTIPTAGKWTIIVNKENDIWGSFRYDEKKDVVRVDVPVQNLGEPAESFFILFDKINATSFNLIAGWDNAKVVLPISLN
ncbi:MAG: DUF2911 domain-containing protein [Ferruginibacter sp.]